jgi:hypothetical protein
MWECMLKRFLLGLYLCFNLKTSCVPIAHSIIKFLVVTSRVGVSLFFFESKSFPFLCDAIYDMYHVLIPLDSVFALLHFLYCV